MSYEDEIESREHKQFPLVSILIPTFNRPKYFERCLESALRQTYPNIEILIGDDSTNTETEKLMKEKYLPQYENIIYIKNKHNLRLFKNANMLLDQANGEFINFLMDDDLLHNYKIEKMMKYYLMDKNHEIKLITAHRQPIDKQGNLLKNIPATTRLFPTDVLMDGKRLGDIVLTTLTNVIGEPTVVLFRKRDLTSPFGTFCGRKYPINIDIASWLTLLVKGKTIYIPETLSWFRIHSSQNQNKLNVFNKGLEEWGHALISSRAYGFLTSNKDFKHAISQYLEKVRINVSSPSQTLTEFCESLAKIRENLESDNNV
ncbi:glycosyltransferase family 2 protein [Chengkuizengella sp. SCS-71B]|uniref:glycosyltransferase family 2 protein n=1 Tax=Chengkuizengella sp. SCS-71B TaxID=3115290 RepID=UPI0032C22C1A